MANQNPEMTLALIRRLQVLGPATMIVIAGLIYAFWDDSQKTLIAGVIAFLAIPDFILFKFIGDRMESGNWQSPEE